MLEPKGYRVLVKKDPIETVSSGGIVLVSNEALEKANMNIGRVVAVGDVAYKAFSPDYKGEPWVKRGDHVIWAKYADRLITDPYTGEEFSILNDEDVIVAAKPGKNEEV